MRWEPARVEHLSEIELQTEQEWSSGDLADLACDRHACVHLPEMARSLVDGDRVLAILGAWEDRDGIATAWAAFSKEGLGCGIRIARSAHRFLSELAARDGLRRIEATIDPQHEAALLFAHRLGFVREGLMEAYGRDGRALWRVARTRF